MQSEIHSITSKMSWDILQFSQKTAHDLFSIFFRFYFFESKCLSEDILFLSFIHIDKISDAIVIQSL